VKTRAQVRAKATGRWRLGVRITALTASIGIVLGIIAIAAAITAVNTRADMARLVENLSPARTNAERLTSIALTQHAGLTQYAASGLGQFRDQYTRAIADEQAVYDETRPMLVGETALLGQLDDVRERLRAWRADVADPIVASVAAGGAKPAMATLPPAGQAQFDAIVGSISTLQSGVFAAREKLRDRVIESTDLVITLLFSAAVVVVIAGVSLFFLLTRFVSQPVVALAEEVRRVAAGDYEHQIRIEGPAEVELLANDVNAMREQIATDLAAVQDARRQVEEANRMLETQADELTRSNRDLEQFAYVASHDLQEPLRKVASFCQLLQRRYAGQLDERADQYIYYAVDGARRMQRLINDLLAFSRIGRVTAGFTDVDLNRVVDDIIALREPGGASAGESGGASGGATITREDLPTVRGEEPLLAALLSNLIANSVKFRRPGEAAVVRVGVARDGDEWELSVRDNGIGISPEFADKVFIIFQRLHSKDAYPGTGIGLSIAKKIVEYHGGRIWVDADYDDGTLIRFTLPAYSNVEPPVSPAPVSPVAESRVEEPAS
jgi:signal transduction histidine kinase